MSWRNAEDLSSSSEALVNVISYAYPETPGLVEISLEQDREGVHITLKDRGRPFDPLQRERKIEEPTSIDGVEEGGLGIHFMREIADHIEYRREEGANCLTLSKRIIH